MHFSTETSWPTGSPFGRSACGSPIRAASVAHAHKRRGIGTRLLRLTAEAILARPERTGLYLWVLEQNDDAKAFYEARGARLVERCPAGPPGGIASRLAGSPWKLRYAWAAQSMQGRAG